MIRFGVVLPLFGTPWREVRATALRAEAAGYDSVWVSDHLLGIPSPETSVLEGWTTLAALAEATERIGLGTLVLSATFRPARVLAKAVQTLASVAGPRLTLGVGAGWHVDEHLAFGLAFPAYEARAARLEETVDAIRELAPGVPVLVGGAGSRVVDLAGRKADFWSVPGDRLDELPELLERFRVRRAETGRRVAVVSRVGLVLADTVAEAQARVARRTSPWSRVGLGPLGLVGDADEVVRRIELHARLGVSAIAIGPSQRDVRDGVLEQLAEEVLSRVP